MWSTIKNPFLFRITRVGNLTLVTQASYVIVTVSCIMDFDLYPFDKQVGSHRTQRRHKNSY